MGTYVLPDTGKAIQIVEENGTLMQTVREFLVSVDAGTGANAAADALDTPGVPQYGDRLDNRFLYPGYSLIVHRRSVEMVDEGTAKVTITYENSFSVDAMEDQFDAPFMDSMAGEVRCSIQQKGSNLDGDGNQVTVSHTFPADDRNHPGETIVQGGEFTFYSAQRSFSIHGIKETNTPWNIANTIIGSVNIYPFSGEAARMWLCTAVNWKPESNYGGVTRYFMRFEFEFNPDSWDPTVVFIDEATNKPPPDLVPGVGIVTVEKLPAVDFEYVIGTFIFGA